MKNCYVCMGDASTTDTEAWVSQARIAHGSQTVQSVTSVVSHTRATTPSAHTAPPSSRPSSTTFLHQSDRPYSSISTDRGSTQAPDSGFWSAAKGMKLCSDSRKKYLTFTEYCRLFGTCNSIFISIWLKA